jgi:hypothetical protein
MTTTEQPRIESVSSDTWMGYRTLTAQLSDGTSKKLFGHYVDEIWIAEGQLVGLTVAEACDLRRNKDIAYLRS